MKNQFSLFSLAVCNKCGNTFVNEEVESGVTVCPACDMGKRRIVREEITEDYARTVELEVSQK